MYSIAIQELYQVTTSDKIGYRSSQVKVIFYILFFTILFSEVWTCQ